MGIACRVMLVSVSGTFLVVGLVVYHRARDRVWNRLFAVHALAVGAWIFSNFLIEVAGSAAASGFWLRVAHPLAALVVCTCVDLAWVFPERITHAPRAHRFILYAIGAVFGMVAFSPDLYKSLRLSDGFVRIDYGWAFNAFGLFAVSGLAYADYVFLRKAYRLAGLQRIQVLYVLAGMAVGQAVAAVTMIVIPVMTKDTTASHWGAGAYVFMAGGMAYAIAKYRIVRPQVALVRAAAYTLTVVVLAVLVFAGVGLLRGLVEGADIALLTSCITAGLVIGIVVVPLHDYVRNRLEGAAKPGLRAEVEQNTAQAILRNLRVDDILAGTCEMVMNSLRPTHMCVMLRDRVSGDFVTRAYRDTRAGHRAEPYLRRLPARHILVRAVVTRRRLLDRDEVFRFADAREAYAVPRAMDGLGLQILAPLLWEEDLIGLVCVGEKRSSDIYETAEMDRLAQMMAPVCLALQNAESYAQMAQMREFSENILRDMESGVIAVDASGRIILYNPAAATILGLKAEQVLGENLLALPFGIRASLTEALSGRESRSALQLTVERPDGQSVPLACSVSCLQRPAADGRAGALAVLHDLSLVQALEREREEAERLSMIRVLAAGMAHEIRNPLVAIQTFADLLPLKWNDAEFRETFMVTAQGEIQRIVGLVSELLMLSKPAGAVTKPIDVPEVCEGVVRGAVGASRGPGGGLAAGAGALDPAPVRGRQPAPSGPPEPRRQRPGRGAGGRRSPAGRRRNFRQQRQRPPGSARDQPAQLHPPGGAGGDLQALLLAQGGRDGFGSGHLPDHRAGTPRDHRIALLPRPGHGVYRAATGGGRRPRCRTS